MRARTRRRIWYNDSWPGNSAGVNMGHETNRIVPILCRVSCYHRNVQTHYYFPVYVSIHHHLLEGRDIQKTTKLSHRKVQHSQSYMRHLGTSWKLLQLTIATHQVTGFWIIFIFKWLHSLKYCNGWCSSCRATGETILQVYSVQTCSLESAS